MSDGKLWRCSICIRHRSLREDSFSGGRLLSEKLVTLLYYWVEMGCEQSVVMKEIGIASEAIVNWYNYFRDICAMWSIDNPGCHRDR